MHVIVNSRGKLIEIQIRTALQQLWAELSEKFSDVIDPAIKYGGGKAGVQVLLTELSTMVAKVEAFEPTLAERPVGFHERLGSLRKDMAKLFRDIIEHAEVFKGEGDDISD